MQYRLRGGIYFTYYRQEMLGKFIPTIIVIYYRIYAKYYVVNTINSSLELLI